MFQQRLKELRESHGFKSQQAFAKAFGVAQSTVGGWESGKREPNYETTKKLALFFNVPIDYLLCMPGVPNIHLSDEQQTAIYKIMTNECKINNLTESEAIARSMVTENFFPRLSKQLLHQASESDLLAVADYLGVKKEVADIIAKDVTLDDFTYAMHKEAKDLSDADKSILLEMARRLRAARESRNEKTR